ncbi:MAG: ABC transporter permease [Planctomycetota bacterium]
MTASFRAIRVIAVREFAALFRLPIGWLIVAVFQLLIGLIFALTVLTPEAPATMRPVFGVAMLIVILVAPAVAMRLISEEARAGTLEVVLSAPVRSWELALGKYLAGMALAGCMLLPMLIHAWLLRTVSEPKPDWGPIAAGMLSLAMLGSVCVALGLLASAMTESQTLAFLGTVLTLTAWVLATTIGPAYVPERFAGALAAASPGRRIDDFARGVIDLRHIVFFTAFTAWLVFAAGVAIERRRWR